MSEEQGYIMERDHGTSERNQGDDYFGGNRNQAGDADAEGGYNKGDVNIDIEQGGDAYARGGDAFAYEEHYVYKEYSEHKEGGEQHDQHDQHEHDTTEYSEEYSVECSDSTGPEVVF